jgi:predicted CoA-substrate-specific enzyme activase
MKKIPKGRIQKIGINDNGRKFLSAGLAMNDQVAIIEGAKHFDPEIKAILNIGAEKFGLILFDDRGRYKKYISNSGCAAGTGSFLDQQAIRLGLESSERLSQLAERFTGEVPRIATRCAVFAKTDLIHTQQKGYTLEAICAGLCRGVTQNILEAVTRGLSLPDTVFVCGGIALNQRVIDYLREFTCREIRVLPFPEKTGAFGAARMAFRESSGLREIKVESAEEIIQPLPSRKKYFYSPLKDIPYRIADVPVFESSIREDVEITLYVKPEKGKESPVYLGFDIGSTSTKAVLMTPGRKVVAGLYTRTQGQPIQAVQRIMRAVYKTEQRFGNVFQIRASGTTGAGRKFIHRILCTDCAIDEINAHARSAYHLKPDIDTIIEIGGQDSKFTVISEGRVVFSVLNYVCAAGTGSFLEEQAKRLGVSIEDYSDLAESVSAPLTSDRCTVFMERDLNHLLGLGYSREELLAAALHSVCDNYLTKVAQISKIGKTVTFQGATARNHALVKVFERKLERTIYVSPYCHLTGALGVCLRLCDQNVTLNPGFRYGFDSESIAVSEEVCKGCENHCKITCVRINDEVLRWGYLCGKDQENAKNRGRTRHEPDLFIYRKRIFEEIPDAGHMLRESTDSRGSREPSARIMKPLVRTRENFSNTIGRTDGCLVRFRELHPGTGDGSNENGSIRIGIPNTLYFMDTLPLWKHLLQNLGYQVVLSSSSNESIQKGKQIAASEFCTPICNLCGHVYALSQCCDAVFLPIIMNRRTSEDSKSYCYYSQYIAAIVQNHLQLHCSERILSPVFEASDSFDTLAHRLFDCLPKSPAFRYTHSGIKTELKNSYQWFREKKQSLREMAKDYLKQMRQIGIVFLGRPYLVHDGCMNNRIPEMVADMGIPVLYQDMLETEQDIQGVGQDLLAWNHWYYGDVILRAAEIIAQSERLFPIFLTAFKCSPDSFIIPYFRDIMDRYRKPYVVLQLDEHNSQEGYDTRLEAAIETFRNHIHRTRQIAPVQISLERNMGNKHYLLPNYDPLVYRLMASAFRRHGFHATPIIETEETVRKSLRLNDGQCLPISALVQGIAYTIASYGLKPENTAFFINAFTQLACNLPQYPILIKQLLEQMGNGLEKVSVYLTDYEMLELPKSVILDVYHAYLIGGLLQKMACRIRPRELHKGETEKVLHEAVEELADVIEKGDSKENTFRHVVSCFSGIKRDGSKIHLPKVAIIGDLYVRDNRVFNQNLIQELEEAGAEVVTTPYNFMLRLMSAKHFHNLIVDRRYLRFIFEKVLLNSLYIFDTKYYRMAIPVLNESVPTFTQDFIDRLSTYHLTYRHTGETAQNLLKVFHLLEQYPDIRLFVHVNPVFCCPALVSDSLFKCVEEDTGIHIVSITYDGTQTRHNQIVIPYIHFIEQDFVDSRKKAGVGQVLRPVE